MKGPIVKRLPPRARAADAVRDQLLELIQSGQLPPGTKLPPEHELARRFAVSRPVVREGLGALRAAGVLDSRSGSGTFVKASQPTGALLLLGRYTPEQLHEVRCHLEVPGAGLAALRRTDEHLRRLTEIVEHHSGGTDVTEWVQDDLAFHVTLAEATGNELHARLVRDLRELQREQSTMMARVGGGALRAPDDEHGAIVDAVQRGDEAGACDAMAAHLAAILQRWRSIDDLGGAETDDAS
jgi:DNA-binding FadR family transcriptional regulator